MHVVARIASINLSFDDFVDEIFTKEAFLRSYAYHISPLNHSSLWPETNDTHIPLPPISRRLPGRPPNKRKRAESEKVLSGKKKKYNISRKGEIQYCKGYGVQGTT